MTADTIQTASKHHPLAVRLACRNDFVEGRGTLREIALKHGVPFGTVRTWASGEYWGRARQRWVDRQTGELPSTAQSPSKADYTPENEDAPTHARKLERLEMQLEALDNLLDAAKTADDWHKLSTARQRLFEQWRILSGIPLPGSRRPRTEKPKPKQHFSGPLPPED